MIKTKPAAALFGGSFDPPHKAHEAIVKTVASFDDIDRLIVVPAFLNPFKKDTAASGQKRLEWCRQLFSGDKVEVSDFEIRQNRPVYTIETLKHMSNDYDIKYLVIGSDNLDMLDKWKEFDEINSMLTWIVFTRETDKPDCSMLKNYRVIYMDIPTSSTNIRDGRDADQVDKAILNDVKKIILNKKGNSDDKRQG